MKISDRLLNRAIFAMLATTIVIGFFFSVVIVPRLIPQEYHYITYMENEVGAMKFSDDEISTDEAVKKFLKRALISITSFDINKTKESDEYSKTFFSDNGWNSFIDEFEVRRKELILQGGLITMSSIILRDPILMNYMEGDGFKMWKFSTSITVKSVGKGGRVVNDFNAVTVLSQITDPKHASAIAIDFLEIR